jgi:ribosomal protein S27E
MANCYVCGKTLLKGNSVKRNVYAGGSVGGYNFSSSVWFNVFLNQLFGDKRSRARSYYHQRVVCDDCAHEIDTKNTRKIVGLLALGLLLIVVILVSNH